MGTSSVPSQKRPASSMTANVPPNNTSSYSSLAHHSPMLLSSSTVSPTSECFFYPALVSVWSWQPPLIPDTTQTASTSQMRDAAGNLLGTILLTTGGYKRNATWMPLIKTETLYVQPKFSKRTRRLTFVALFQPDTQLSHPLINGGQLDQSPQRPMLALPS